MTNLERVGKAMELLRDGLSSFVDRELTSQFGDEHFRSIQQGLREKPDATVYDPALLLGILWNQWNEVFARTLGRSERSIVSELRDVRNRWAHMNAFSGDDAYRALDSISRLLMAVSAPQAEEVERIKQELLRSRFDEQVRQEKRRVNTSSIESSVTGSLKAWREVVTPHPDVASGRYRQAEFAADLWQVHIGEGSAEYREPIEFFRRTFMTQSLNALLLDAVRRLSGQPGDPVVQLQTNFGGGKTHSMLALYHMVCGKKAGELPGLEAVLAASGLSQLPHAKRVVLVGNKLSPGNPSVKADGTVVNTLWGELAYQLGGKAAYAKIRLDDERATSPGDKLREILNEYGPSLILIDEWVAYARQLHSESDLPGGSFETQFSFAQALTESAKLAKNCLLVVSLPASDTAAFPHAQGDDIEVGGLRGREALDRLRNVIGRVESSWRPASAEESFEIVRRRLFQPLVDQEQYKSRDYIARSFFDLYQTQLQEFPPECHDGEYEKRLKDAYPIHPEVFDRLYSDWSTLPKFQRTRGVLRLMAAVIHALWESGDRNPLIMPGNIPIDNQRVQFELTRYLSDNWVPVILKDVDGPSALPAQIDSEIPNLGKFQACRRAARTIYLGSAPMMGAANVGIEDRRVKLGCVMPGEQPVVFGDALRRLASAATYLYQDGVRYWYSIQPTVTKLAEDRAEALKRDPDKVAQEIERRVKKDLNNVGDFSRIHAFPQSGADVQDDRDARLVVLSSDHPYTKEDGNLALLRAQELLKARGSGPRIYQNTLAFLAVDKAKLQDLEEATRRYLAWESITDDKALESELTAGQVRQAQNQKLSADSTVAARIPESFQWLIVPVQDSPQKQVEWNPYRLSGQDPLAARASKKMRNDELLLASFAPSRLKMELDRVPLWQGEDKHHVSVRDVVDYFARYIYLPRLKTPGLLLNAIQDGLKLLTWEHDSFAYADFYDEDAKRYRGLVCGTAISLGTEIPSGLIVRADVALKQLAAEKPESAVSGEEPEPTGGQGLGGLFNPTAPARTVVPATHYHASVELDSSRVGRDAGRIADEVISHLVGLVGSRVKITLEIEAEIPSGTPDDVVRIVTQNGRDLHFESQGFDE